MLIRARVSVGLALFLLAAACAGGAEDPSSGAGGSGDELIVQAANYDLVAGEDSRFIVGLLTPDQLFVSFGSVDMEFFYLGTREGEGTARKGPTASGRFLPIAGSQIHDPQPETPTAVSGAQGRGVYSAEVTFDRAGFWAAQVTAELEDGPVTGRAVFEVYEDNRYPAVGERAPRTDNLTVTSQDAPREAIDSRARDGARITDAELHRITIADSIRKREPALVVFATPVYCVSRFCGPITDMVASLEREYRDRANFIHIEIWRDFQNTVVNEAAAEWIYRKGDLTEPWIYLIDRDGRIAARWDNVATRQEIEPLLNELPPLR